VDGEQKEGDVDAYDRVNYEPRTRLDTTHHRAGEKPSDWSDDGLQIYGTHHRLQ
jgi:hypothetical protein